MGRSRILMQISNSYSRFSIFFGNPIETHLHFSGPGALYAVFFSYVGLGLTMVFGKEKIFWMGNLFQFNLLEQKVLSLIVVTISG